MNNKPCVTILEHDDDFVSLEVNGVDFRLPVNNALSDAVRYEGGLTILPLKGFTIYHQKGGDCYVE